VQAALDDAMAQIQQLDEQLTAAENNLVERRRGEAASEQLKAAQSAAGREDPGAQRRRITPRREDKLLRQAEELKTSLTDQVMDLVAAGSPT
jgi:hypothetical protein